MINRLRLPLIIALLAGVAVLFQAFHRPGAVSAAFAGEPELIAATFSSEWCASCRVLKPNLARVLPDFASKPVRFVEYDFTFGQTEAMRAQADADGVGDIYARFKGATGFTVLVDADSGEIIDTLTMNHSPAAMAAALDDALAVAEAHTDDPPKDI
ncbi:MAG: hypothetical protein RIC52_10245 [Amphiplicatus sp.]